jgi:hypothetical protein
MLAAAHFDNLLVFLFFGVAILFQLLSAAAAKKRKQQRDDPRRRSPSQTSRPLATEREETDEDRVRKFLEALGQPTTSKPPPPAAPRPTYQKPIVVERGEPDVLRRRWVGLPPLTTRPPDLPTETAPPTPVVRKREPQPVRSKVTEAPKFEVHAGPPPLESTTEVEAKTAATSQPRDLATMLRSASGLRDAIILREIFGPPRSMQPLDLTGSV